MEEATIKLWLLTRYQVYVLVKLRRYVRRKVAQKVKIAWLNQIIKVNKAKFI